MRGSTWWSPACRSRRGSGSPAPGSPGRNSRPISRRTSPRNRAMPAYDGRLFDPPAPIARVVLRHPDREASVADVPLLIDSGADATLLPRAAVASLGLDATGERYQLIGFDGTISESEAVLARLVFLRRTF